jgi:hypothetical protein
MTCQARPERTDPATLRCLVCRIAWDVGDTDPPLCPRTQVAQRGAQERLPIIADARQPRFFGDKVETPRFVSALAPDPFAGGSR